MNLGEWVLVVMWTTSLVVSAYLHGLPKEKSHWNFYQTFFSVAVGAAILYWAGLFRNVF